MCRRLLCNRIKRIGFLLLPSWTHLSCTHRLLVQVESPATPDIPCRLLQQGFAGEERESAVVQNDGPMGHGFGKLPSKPSLDNGHFFFLFSEMLGKLFVIHPEKVHFAFGIKTEGWALPAKLNQSVIRA